MPRITAVLFDYGLVLSGPPDPAAWMGMKAFLHADESAFHAAYWRPRHAYDRGDLNATAYWKSVASEFGQTLDAKGLQRLSELDTALWTQPNQPMIDWAARLQAAGVKTGILSNIGDAMEAGVRAQCPWLEGFSHRTFSHNLGIAKPELAIYRHAATGLLTPAPEILFIDDREDNLAAAAEAGLVTVQYVNHPQFVTAMEELGLGELLSI